MALIEQVVRSLIQLLFVDTEQAPPCTRANVRITLSFTLSYAKPCRDG
jgi:hypothetical protein